MIRHWHDAGHAVAVCSLVHSSAEDEEGRGLAVPCTALHAQLVHEPLQMAHRVARRPVPRPSSIGCFRSPAMAATVRRLLAAQPWDLTSVPCSSVVPYVEHVQDVPKILDFGDIDSQKRLGYAHHGPAPGLSGATRSRSRGRCARKGAWRGPSTCAPRRRVRSDRRCRTTPSACRKRGFRRASTPTSSFRPTAPTTPTLSASSAAWTAIRTSRHAALLRTGVAAAARRAAGGLDAEPGHRLLVVDRSEPIAHATLRLAGDAERARRPADRCARMLSPHAWTRSMWRLDAIVARCVDHCRTELAA